MERDKNKVLSFIFLLFLIQGVLADNGPVLWWIPIVIFCIFAVFILATFICVIAARRRALQRMQQRGFYSYYSHGYGVAPPQAGGPQQPIQPYTVSYNGSYPPQPMPPIYANANSYPATAPPPPGFANSAFYPTINEVAPPKYDALVKQEKENF